MPAFGKFSVNAPFFQHGARRSDSFTEGHAAVHSGKGKGNIDIDTDVDIDIDIDIKKVSDNSREQALNLQIKYSLHKLNKSDKNESRIVDF